MHVYMNFHACTYVCTHVFTRAYMHVQMYPCAILQAWERCRFREIAEIREEHRLKQEELDIKREIALKE